LESVHLAAPSAPAEIDSAPGRLSNATFGCICVLAAALFWSAGGVVAKTLPLDPLTVAFYRSFVAGLALLPFVRPSRWVIRPVMFPGAVCFGAMIGAYIGAIKATTAANAIFLQCTSIFWVVPLSAVLLHERPDRRSLWGIALALIGIAAIILYGYAGQPGEWRGIALGLASGIGYASVVVLLSALRALDPLWLSAFNNLGGALALGAWMLIMTGDILRPTRTQIRIPVAFGTFQMAIPYALFARGLREIGAA
jgi:drug/metabolite transporter (DMT)-like permease